MNQLVKRNFTGALCTWVDCHAGAEYPQTDAQGRRWADLCSTHAVELSDALKAGVKSSLSAWVKASGGAKKLAGST